MKNTTEKKADKKWKKTWNNVLFWVKDFNHNFRPEKVKRTNKVLREKSHRVV